MLHPCVMQIRVKGRRNADSSEGQQRRLQMRNGLERNTAPPPQGPQQRDWPAIEPNLRSLSSSRASSCRAVCMNYANNHPMAFQIINDLGFDFWVTCQKQSLKFSVSFVPPFPSTHFIFYVTIFFFSRFLTFFKLFFRKFFHSKSQTVKVESNRVKLS